MSDLTTQIAEQIPEMDWLTHGLNLREANAKPGAEPKMAKVLGRCKSYNSRGRGEAEYRRVILPGSSVAQWATDAGETEGTWGRDSGREYVFLPEGTIVVSYETETTKYGKGRAKLDAGVICDASAPSSETIAWGLTARRKGNDVIVTLPDGSKLTF